MIIRRGGNTPIHFTQGKDKDFREKGKQICLIK